MGVAANSVTQLQVDAINDQIEAEKIEGITVALDSQLATAEAATTANAAALTAINAMLGAGNEKPNLAEAITALQAGSKTTTEALTAMTAERDSWKAKAVKFGAEPAAAATATTQEETDKITDSNNANAASAYYSEADASLVQLRAAAGIKPKPAAK